MADPPESFLPMIFKGKSRNVSRSKEPTGQNPHKVFSRPEISRSTKSLKQNVCVEMLQNGDHRSFSELVCVLSLERRRRRDSTDPRVIDSLPRPLQDRPEQIHNLKHHLTHAEHAQRTAGNKHIEGEAVFKLGVTSQICGDHSAAKKYLHMYMRICEEMKDTSGLGKAYKSLAKTFESEGDTQEALLCLEKLCDGSIDAPPHDSVHAYLTAGGLYFNMRSFGRACASYQRGVDGAAALGDVAALHKAQVLLGRARAHSMIGSFSVALRVPGGPSLQRLLDWKDRREWDPEPRDSPDDTGPRESPDDTGPRESTDDTGPRESPDDTGPRDSPDDTGPRDSTDDTTARK